MSQFTVSSLADITASTSGIAAGLTNAASDVTTWMTDAATRIANLNDAVQAVASCQSGTSAPANLQGQLWYKTSTNQLFVDPDGAGADDEIATRLYGYLIDFATAGTATFRLGGVIHVDTTQVSKTSAAVLMTYTLPGGTLARDKMFVEVDAWGTRSGSSGTFSLQPRLVTTAITTHSSGAGGAAATDWHIHFVVIRTGAATQDCGSYMVLNRDDDGSTTLCDFATASATLSGDVAVNINLSAISAGTVTQEIMIVRLGNPS